jgi:lipopolysaccharide export system permease protein
MRLPRTLFRYLSREILLYGLLTFLAIVTILVSHNLFRRLEYLLAIGFTYADVWVLLRCLLPMVATSAVPFSFVVGVLLTVRRLASEAEILAMRASGIGLTTLLIPILTIAIVISSITAYLQISVEHAAQRELLVLFKSVAARGGMFKAGRFANLSYGVFFVESRGRDGSLHGISISDNSNPQRPYMIFAESGSFTYDEQASVIRLHLRNGEVHLEPTRNSPDQYKRIHFDDFHYPIDVSTHLRNTGLAVRPKQMALPELRDVIARTQRGEKLWFVDEQNTAEYEMEIYRRYILPLAPVIFSLIALPLGVAGARRGNNIGILICLVMVFAYYGTLSLTASLARTGSLSPAMALWLPNLLFLALGLLLFRHENRGLTR